MVVRRYLAIENLSSKRDSKSLICPGVQTDLILVEKSLLAIKGISEMVCEFCRQKRKSWKLIMAARGTERDWRKGMGHREVLTDRQQTG